MRAESDPWRFAAVSGGLLLMTVACTVVFAADVDGPVRTVVALAGFLLFVPGLALAELLPVQG